MQRFAGKAALVTGAGSGIGRAVALRLAGEGAHVFCADVSEQAVRETQAAIVAAGGRAEAYACDVGDEAAVRACVQACVDACGRIDHLSNMAGILRFDHFHELTLADFRRVIEVNLYGTFMMCREAIPHLLATKGNIVNAASTSALAGLPEDFVEGHQADDEGLVTISTDYPDVLPFLTFSSDAAARANKAWKRRLAEYEAPKLDEGIRDGLREFIEAKKAGMADAWY